MQEIIVNSHSSVIENDEIVYPSDSDKGDECESTPKPENDCCCKTYNVVLHFH